MKIPPLYLLASALVLLAFISKLATGDFSRQAEANAQITQQKQAQKQKQRELKLAQIEADGKEAIAKSRYDKGCQMIFAGNSPDKFAALLQGKPVYDANLRQPIADGIVVCDPVGMTGIIRDGVIADTAFTSDRQVIAAAMKRYESAQYAAPIIQ